MSQGRINPEGIEGMEFDIPLLLDSNYKHVVGRGKLVVEGDEVTITIKARGNDARDLLHLFANMPPMALSFAGIPVRPHSTKKES